jgi:hypothetical protein
MSEDVNEKASVIVISEFVIILTAIANNINEKDKTW